LHELSLAQDVLRTCVARMQSAAGRIERVRVAVGELSAVEPIQLGYA
jgi:Zn finger protein HypA/HybF involved in hydrogenase expression